MRLKPQDNQNPIAFIRKIQKLVGLRLIEYGIMGDERQTVLLYVGRTLKTRQKDFFGEFYTGIDHGLDAHEEFRTIIPNWLTVMLLSQENAEQVVEWLTDELEADVHDILKPFQKD